MTRQNGSQRRVTLRAAWKSASAIERRRFIAEILVDHLLSPAIGAPPPPLPAAPARPVDDVPDLETFLSICVVRSPGDRVQSSALYERYRSLALSLDRSPMTQKAFSIQLCKRGYVKRQSSVIWFVGIKLVDVAAGAP